MPQLFIRLGMLGSVFTTSCTLAFFLQFLCCNCAKKLATVDQIGPDENGIELLEGQNNLIDKRGHRLEDFFWTGSGDGSDGQVWESQNLPTIYQTKTILSTVYIAETSTPLNNRTEQTTACPINCDVSTTPQEEIVPTQTLKPGQNDTDDDFYDADRHFWLLTVLKGDGKDPIVTDLKNSLAKLYKTAFQRQQELHLGINSRTKRDAATADKPVNVYIHRVEKTPNNGEENIEVLYHVSVSGQPVTATAAAADMSLISDDEVTTELGYPFVIKAEPYWKPKEPQYLTSSNNTWVFIGVSLSILIVLLLLVALLTLALSKRSKAKDTNEEDVSQQDVKVGISNKAFISNESERHLDHARRPKSSTYINFKTESPSSQSSTSFSSLDVSPLMTLKRPTPKKISLARPKAATNKTAPMLQQHRKQTTNSDFDSDSSNEKIRIASKDIHVLDGNRGSGVVSPKSYLSMPSVKSFPRVNIPEPLNKVLEPVSVLHLDIDDESPRSPGSRNYESCLTRQASLSTVEDPGVVNPAIWKGHTNRIQNEALDDVKIATNASRMRKRFHNLLDETFSLFGSQRDSSAEDERSVALQGKSHSAISKRQIQEKQRNVSARPKTSDPRRSKIDSSEAPRGAWATNDATPLSRSLSAGSFRRPMTAGIDPDRILVEGSLSPNDMAVPLITAIKTELNKCSLPGSTSNLVE